MLCPICLFPMEKIRNHEGEVFVYYCNQCEIAYWKEYNESDKFPFIFCPRCGNKQVTIEAIGDCHGVYELKRCTFCEHE